MGTYDLHVRFNPQHDDMEFNHLLTLAATLGYTGLAIDSPMGSEIVQTEKSLELLRRVTFSPRSATRLRFHVNKQLKQTDLLVIHGRTKPILLAAAEIPNVHMIMLKDIEDFMVIDSQVARAMAKREKIVEICLNKLLTVSGTLRSRLMRVMRTALDHIVRTKCSFVLTSGAQHPCELRAPKDMMALSYLASVPEELARKAMQQHPFALVSRLRESSDTDSSNSVRRET